MEILNRQENHITCNEFTRDSDKMLTAADHCFILNYILKIWG